MQDSREWWHGEYMQREWVSILLGRGNMVLPTHSLQDNAPGTKAPMILVPGDLLVAPDALSVRVDDGGLVATWHEVKAKSKPGWKRLPEPGRWEHGIDYANLLDYREVQERSGWPVVLVVCETSSPEAPAKESRLIPGRRWLWVRLDDALEKGEHRPTWPGGEHDTTRRGRRKMGGWLWPRAIMRELRP